MTGRVYVCMYVCMYGDLLSVNSPCIDDLTRSCALTGTSGGQFEGRYSGRSGYSTHCRSKYMYICLIVCLKK